ncbi:polysaccharide lyase family 3 protein [Gonapodya prolifera JEL478]|uniref:Pectate lyase n=1 Tax=Gonapodya prolifera (strain JEL478) TaxID=1344416 RepID=A0A139AW76_GONPJ|nr:polysaccharide lyase family 3 protein [Gonapodya prolifera JEL478]|eukprot:KXS20978.1 polysaccharide lyase family 3 protein [Gonapodya prolifera JEL478]
MIIKSTLGLLFLALTASSAHARANFKVDESDFNIAMSHRILTARDLVADLTIDGDVELAARAFGNDGLPSTFPSATGSRSCSAPITVSGTFDGGMYRYDRGAGFRDSNNCLSIEPGSADTIFLLNDGATLQNVIIGREVLESVYCLGSCTLTNVWFEETCEDSLSFKNPTNCSSCVMSWTGGAVNGFHDKASKGKFYRSCGGCSFRNRHVEVTNVRAHGVPGEAFVGINTSKAKDSAKFKSISIPSSFGTSWPVCKKFGTSETSGPDDTFCIYSSSDITFMSS